MLERETIYQRVWGYAMAHGDRSVDVFVRKLRQKLEKRSPGWSYIHTHFGVGYRFDPEPASPVGGDGSRSHGWLPRRLRDSRRSPATQPRLPGRSRRRSEQPLASNRPRLFTARSQELHTP